MDEEKENAAGSRTMQFVRAMRGDALFAAAWCLLWGAVSLVPGCGGTSDAVGSVWADHLRLTGCGVLVGVKDGARTRIAFLTARHVATCNGFFRSPSWYNAVYLKSEGSAFKYRRIADIAPERWFCAEEDLDFAWFELTTDEIMKISRDGRLPPHVSLDGDSTGDGAVATFDSGRIGFLNEKDAVEVVTISCWPIIESGISFPFVPLMGWSIMFADRKEALIGEMWKREKVFDEYNINKKTLDLVQNTIQVRLHENNSGAPVFAQGRQNGGLPNLVGIVVSKNDEKAIGGFQSIHKAVETIRHSILKGEGLKLVNEKRFW